MLKKYAFLNLILLLSQGCQTLPPPISVNVPLVFEEGFASCMGNDGSVRASLYYKDSVIQTLPFDWIAYINNGWTLESTSPLGQTLFRLSYLKKSKSFQKSGAVPSSFPIPTIDEKNYLVIDGRRIGVKVDEAPCVLSGHMPLSWLDQLILWQESKEEIRYQAADDFRNIETHMEIDEQGSISFCANISWTYYWGLYSQELQWCSSHRITTIRGIDDYKLELETREGS